MTEADVRKFAHQNGLPQDYVNPFYSSMTARASKSGTQGHGLPFEVFDSFVSSRERALRRIFVKLDKGEFVARAQRRVL